MEEYYMIHIYFKTNNKEGHTIYGLDAKSKKEVHKNISDEVKELQNKHTDLVVKNINIF